MLVVKPLIGPGVIPKKCVSNFVADKINRGLACGGSAKNRVCNRPFVLCPYNSVIAVIPQVFFGFFGADGQCKLAKFLA